MTVKNRRESSGTSGRPQSRGDGGTEAARTEAGWTETDGPAVKNHGKSAG